VSVSGAELLKRVKEQIREVDPSEVSQLLGEGVVVVDCRETEELAGGMIPGALHIPRSYLETRIEATVPDRSQRIILYCASGVRSAFGAHTLMTEMGYDDVESMTGGFTLWKDRGYEVDVPRSLTPEQRDRYSRHLLVPEVGLEGQQKLLDARVLLLGAGGLGSPTALYLAAAGVGTIGIVDDDVVDLSNLQRQVIHNTERIGVPKTDSAAEAIRALNPDVEVVGYPTRLDASNIMEIIEGWDVIVDGVDNFPTRYLLNDASVRLKIPVVSAAILGFEGQLSVFAPYEGPCYRCLFRQPPPAELAPSCGANGVLGVLPGTMGLLQATEVIKLIIGAGEPLIGRLLMYDALEATFTELKVRRDPDCPICSREPDAIADDELGVFPDYEAFCAASGYSADMATVRIPPVLRPAVGGEREVTAAGSSVGEVLTALVEAHPETREQIFAEDGELNRYVNVYLNDEDVRVLDGLGTAVGEGDELVILPAMAGGSA
jgi:molybdopterin/thiamine biosynthesis adenylyltransferase/rhodanese-related sulfurtransferase/molybdopterin converting factor small subunit